MESSIRGPWWMWWCNPLVQMHPDQKKRFLPSLSSDSKDQVTYWEVDSLRATLGLSIIPEEKVFNDPFIGMWILFEAPDLQLAQLTLPAITFDASLLKLTPQQWKNLYGIENKEYIRNLITFTKKIPKELVVPMKGLANLFETHQEKTGVRFTLWERTNVVVSIYFSNRFPAFSRRWFLNLSDNELVLVEGFLGQESEAVDVFCQFIEPELLNGIQFLQKKYEVPELDFESLAD